MSSQDERIAAQLFDRYLEAAPPEKDTVKQALLAKCPSSKRADLRLAMEGMDFVSEHYSQTTAQQSLVNAFLGEVRADKGKQRRLEEFRRSIALPARPRAEELVAQMSAYLLQAVPSYSLSKNAAPASQPASAHVFNRKPALPASSATFRPDALWWRQTEARVGQRAENILKEIGVSRAPVSLQAVTEFMHLFVVDADMAEADGYLVTDHEVGAILLNSNMGPSRRKRYTWAHELGHFSLHTGTGIFRDNFSESSELFHSKEELEANIFASFLLMPSFLLPADFATDLPSFERAEQIRTDYDVSLTAAFWRIVRASKHRCALVETLRGSYKWHVASPGFHGYVRPTPDTLATQMARGEGLNEEAWTFEASAWVEGGVAHEGLPIRERSRRTHSGHVYTLLTVVE